MKEFDKQFTCQFEIKLQSTCNRSAYACLQTVCNLRSYVFHVSCGGAWVGGKGRSSAHDIHGIERLSQFEHQSLTQESLLDSYVFFSANFSRHWHYWFFDALMYPYTFIRSYPYTLRAWYLYILIQLYPCTLIPLYLHVTFLYSYTTHTFIFLFS